MGRGAGVRGHALVLVLVVLLGLQLLAHGALTLALGERAAARGGLRVLQARAAAEAAVTLAAGTRPIDAPEALPLLTRIPVGSGWAGPHPSRAYVQRVGREVWLVEGEGGAPGADWRWRVGRLVWALDPAARGGEAYEAILAGGAPLPPDGLTETAPFRPGSAPDWCRPWAAALDSLLPPPPRSGVGGALAGAWPAVGLLGLGDLTGALAGRVEGTGTPHPVLDGEGCVAGPWNWGDPLDPRGPCGRVSVAAAAPGDLTVDGGRGQGLLVVGGSLLLRGTTFHGLVLAGGDVELEGGARVVGQVRAGGVVRGDGGSRVVSSPCSVARALQAGDEALRAPRTLPGTGSFPLW